MISLPASTYRLQLREGMDFDRAATVVSYLADLGIGALYLSPIFTAAPGSTHGYDVTDPDEIEPSLGGRAGFERLAAACRDAGLAVVIDIVPNHTAFTVENRWLRDVLRHGRDSRYARHFDIFWDAEGADGRLRLPWLGKPFAEALEAGELSVVDEDDGPALDTGGLRVPLAGAPSDAARAGESDAIAALHDAQPWRLASWQTESAAISHRRFFTVTGLVGMRVEDEPVFEDMHRLTFELVDRGLVQGVRIDHVDGLLDPTAYLARLRGRLPETPIWIEKILTGEERLRLDWPVEGTTGYVLARRLAQVLTDAAGAEAVTRRLGEVAGERPDFRAELDEAKRQIVRQELPAELDQLTEMFRQAAPDAEHGREALRRALIEFIAAFPRYRTYATAEGMDEDDAAIVRDTAARAAEPLPEAGALPLLADTLLAPEGAALRLRLQQVTGAAIAKSQEDTAFYRYVALLSANEVGAEPDEPAMTPDAFHEAMARRASDMPHGLSLTSSHDTKRAEDARMRIAALSHHPATFDALLALVPDDVPVEWRWYLAQSAFAARPGGDLAERLEAHVEKAVREAKRDTFWIAPDEGFEGRIRAAAQAVAGALDPLPAALDGVARTAEGLVVAQAALKLTCPGIPDIYQGTEIGSFLLTDPDNRRPVRFDALVRGDVAGLDAVKLSLTRTLLRLRRDRPEVFLTGDYVPREGGAGRLSFARLSGGQGIAVTVSTDGRPIDAPADVWPPAALGPQAARIEAV